ncbi:glycosyltransferase family 2 protein [Aestuariibaculum sp. YM273]|uniref:glycosyltransferase family 2 protein n=1 Tax=Aestuariibaculum sp. YM273 TaxID=3070659 RepID=UPI0027DCC124|nr:glycosyltransferase [Aestuariibaculum sp. YM273]WMI65818.1 glycosyltransferase family 2 protein [Aestuariibaculum sp. YM273]
MQASILIVSKNRKEELEKTLLILENLIDLTSQEVLVYLDGCTDNSFILEDGFDWVKWFAGKDSIGASAARNLLFKNAKGNILIGLDDDAHPLSNDFVVLSQQLFKEFPKVGVLAFQEIKGVFKTDEDALNNSSKLVEEYFCREFVGCGFAIRKVVYEVTNGFPDWIDIYGEESCLSIEVLAKGYEILYTTKIKINHRVDRKERIQKGRNYFRFGKQLKNTAFYYLVYYPNPIFRIIKLFRHNFKKYGCKDWSYFKVYIIAMFKILFFLPKLKRYRNPITKKTIKKSVALPLPKYY